MNASQCYVIGTLPVLLMIMRELRLMHTYHAVPMPCRAAKGLDLSFLFDLHSAAVFDSHMPFRDHAVLKATSQGHGTERHGRDMAWHV
jgi:hypothetical protein